MHLHPKRVALAALSLFALAIACATATPILADEASGEPSGLEHSWRYDDGERIPYPDTDRDASADDGTVDVMPLAMNFRVRKQDGVYTATFGGSTMTVTNARAFGIDVSEHNGTIDWAKAKADGVDFAILRLGWGTYGEHGAYGASSTDATFTRNYQGAKAAGIKVGVYLYSYAGWTGLQSRSYWEDYASREADHVLTVLGQLGVGPSDLDYPIYYDLEESYLENGTLHFATDTVANRTFLAGIARTFCDRIEGAGYSVGVYANLNWWNNYLTDPVFDRWERWVARYPSSGAANQSSLYQKDHGIWQAHSEAWVDGVGTCDINFDYRDRAAKGTVQDAPQGPALSYPEGSMVRLYDPATGVHHFTTDQHEANVLVSRGWNDEGVAWTCGPSGLPVYRLYDPATGDHHYTMDPNERNGLMRSGWTDEGIAFTAGGKTPVYRLYNPNLTQGSHHFVTSTQERDALVRNGWIYEAIGFIAQ